MTLHQKAVELWLWASTHLLSLKALHIAGIWNVGADLMCQGGPREGEWRLHPDIVKQIWRRFWKSGSGPLYIQRENTLFSMVFIESAERADNGSGCFSTLSNGHRLLNAFPPVLLIDRLLARIRPERMTVILVSPEQVIAH